jgi:hypothetical protein
MTKTCVLNLEMPNDVDRGHHNETFKALKLHHLLYGLHVLNVFFSLRMHLVLNGRGIIAFCTIYDYGELK